MRTPRKVAVTGATGFIGTNILNIFTRQGVEVKALCRPRSAGIRPDLPGIQWIEGCIEDQHSLEDLISGVEAVVHCAGIVRAKRHQDFFEVNTKGTKNLMGALKETGLNGRLILISSMAARHPWISPYAKSKSEAEREVRDGSPVPWTIIRPPAVYGPGDRAILPFFRAMEKGVALIPAPASNRFSLIHVVDLAEAVLDACTCTRVLQKRIEIHDGTPEGYAWTDVIETFEQVRGRKVISVVLPPAFLRIAGFVGLAFSRLSSRPVMLTPWKVRELLHPDWVCTNHVENHGLSWTPRITLKIALENGLIG